MPVKNALEIERIQQLGRGYKRNREVTDIALRLLKGEQVSTIQPLITALKRHNPFRQTRRRIAAIALGKGDLSVEQNETTITVLRQVIRQIPGIDHIKSALLLLKLASVFGILLIIPFIKPGIQLTDDIDTAIRLVFNLIVALALTLYVFMLLRYRNDAVRVEAICALGNRGDMKAIRDITASYYDKNKHVRKASALALHKLLPQIHTSRTYHIMMAQEIWTRNWAKIS